MICSDCSFIYELKFPITKIVDGQMKVKLLVASICSLTEFLSLNQASTIEI